MIAFFGTAIELRTFKFNSPTGISPHTKCLTLYIFLATLTSSIPFVRPTQSFASSYAYCEHGQAPHLQASAA